MLLPHNCVCCRTYSRRCYNWLSVVPWVLYHIFSYLSILLMKKVFIFSAIFLANSCMLMQYFCMFIHFYIQKIIHNIQCIPYYVIYTPLFSTIECDLFRVYHIHLRLFVVYYSSFMHFCIPNIYT
jgi:hypothetical protein